MGPQPFSLIVSESDGNRPLERHAEGSCRILDLYLTNQPPSALDPEPVSVFRTGDALNFVAMVEVSENADYGSFFGLLEIVFRIETQAGELVMQSVIAHHTVPMLPPTEIFADGVTVPSEMAADQYTAQVVVNLANGTSAQAEVPFEIE
jgi:hypothetical protein